ncbi:hypothetical protein [Jiulongibacter sp. NS-SX5]|uniref:hypothetical protein n=1 Tax=Jiulongibacter sp. NS-SX5 TaxID=3463854 RepID=UPI00405972D7
MNLRLLTFLCFIALLSCKERPYEVKSKTGAIYHWKSTYNPDSTSLQKLDELGICKQYIRFFDIDKKDDQFPQPKSVIRFKQRPRYTVIPVVYLTNRSLKNLKTEEIDNLAMQTAEKVTQIAKQNDIDIEALQLDCDWSKSTKDAYFQYLRTLDKTLDPEIELSSTLRLHQVKFREQTGVPPVDRTALMLYNVGDWTNPQTENSLFDPLIIDQYLSRIPEYPLPMDLALPIYQQALVYRQNKLFTFIKNKDLEDISEEIDLKIAKNASTYVCQENGQYLNKSFRKGDIFRFENVEFRELNLVNRAVLQRIQNEDLDLIFYHLDEGPLSLYRKKEFIELLY